MACVLQGASNFFADEGEMCGDWSANLIGAQALTVFAALTLAAINTVLKEVLHCTCRAASLAKPSVRARVCVPAVAAHASCGVLLQPSCRTSVTTQRRTRVRRLRTSCSSHSSSTRASWC